MNRILVESSTIKSIGYNFKQAILEIEFIRGAVYRYFNVPQSEFLALKFANSKGKYFSNNIVKNYKFKKVSE